VYVLDKTLPVKPASQQGQIPLLLFGLRKENGFHHGEGLNGNLSFPAPTYIKFTGRGGEREERVTIGTGEERPPCSQVFNAHKDRSSKHRRDTSLHGHGKVAHKTNA
jgi:hypothetical protein